MSGTAGRRGFTLLLALLGLGGFVAARRNSIRRAAALLGTHIPRGAMAIRRESLVDLTIDGRPIRQTVFIAESAEDSEVLAGQSEEIHAAMSDNIEPLDDDRDELLDPDPGESNSSGTTTELEDPPSPATFNADELHAEAEAVLAEAERIEEDAVIDHVVEADLAHDAAIEASAAAPDAVGAPGESLDETLEDEVVDEAEAVIEEAVDEEVEDVPPTHVSAWEGSCPDSHPIKVRFATGRFHEPGTPSYDQVVADACYQSIEAAEADGFSASPL